MASWARTTNKSWAVAHATSVSKAMPSNTTASNTIICGTSRYAGTIDITKITDSLGNTYSTAYDGVNSYYSSHNNTSMATNIFGGANTITYNPGVTDYISINFIEYNTAGATPQVDGAGSTYAPGNTSVSTPATPSYATAGNNLLFGFVSFPGSMPATITPDSPYATVNTTSASGMPSNTCDQINVSAGTYNASWTFSSAVTVLCTFIAFKLPASGGGGSAITPRLVGRGITPVK